MSWTLSGTYYEACNCEAICPCRRQGSRKGGRSTFGICDFVLSWMIEKGEADGLDLAGRKVVMIGNYDDDEPLSPWRVALYVDEDALPEQHHTLAEIFVGRRGGDTFAQYARAITEVKSVRSASIRLDHTTDSQRIDVDPFVTVATRHPVDHDEPVSCGIAGHHLPGREIVADVMRAEDGDFGFEVRGRCGFATSFAYSG